MHKLFITIVIITASCVIRSTYASISITGNINPSIKSIADISPESAIEVHMLSAPIILNPAVDGISANDPRIKTLIAYAKFWDKSISVVFSNLNNLRYVKQLLVLFKANHIHTDLPQLSKTKNLAEFNLIKIYVIEDKNHVSESKPAINHAAGI